MSRSKAASIRRHNHRRSLKRRRQQQQANRLDFQTLEDRQLLATFLVTSLADGPVSGPGDLPGSLRQAMFDANATEESDVINIAVGGTIELESQLPTISAPVSIGPLLGGTQITLDAGGDGRGNGNGFRVFEIDDGTSAQIDVTLNGLTIAGGDAARATALAPAESGGGILSRENLTIIQSTITNNSAGPGTRASGSTDDDGGSGGGIANFGTVTLIQSTVSNNQAGHGGRGRSGTLQGGNGGDGGAGGGVFNAGTLTVISSTISGNRAGDGGAGGDTGTAGGEGGGGDGGGGGGIFSSGTLTVTSSTVSGNRAGYAGYGGFYIDEDGEFSFIPYGPYGSDGAGGGIGSTGSFTLTNSIVAGNRSFDAPDLRTNSTQAPNVDFSLIGNNEGSGLNEAQTADARGNLIGSNTNRINPLLGPLADNGGPTQTHALLNGSPAINEGFPFPAESTDQRGQSLTNVASPDMGAFEQQAIESTTIVVRRTTDFGANDFSSDFLSLREAIAITNLSTGPDTIVFGPAFDEQQTLQLNGGEMEITDTLSIEGPGQELLTLDGGLDGERVFNFSAPTGDLALSGLRVTGGQTTGDNANGADHTFDGGGIRFLSGGTLTLTNSTVEGNSTSGNIARGGGIFTEGNLVLNGSTVSGNSTAQQFGHGGGIYTSAGSVTLNQSTVSDNSTAGSGSDGGGIHTRGSDLSIINSTISGNTTTAANADGGGVYSRAVIVLDRSTVSGNRTSGSSSDGGGIFSTGAITLVNATVSGNRVTSLVTHGGGIAATDDVTITQSTITDNSVLLHFASDGGGVWHDSSLGMIQITNSIVAGNSASGGTADIALGGSSLDVDFSLIGVANGPNAPTVSTDFNETGTQDNPLNPLLGPLADNGGPTETRALLAGSAAIDAGLNFYAKDQNGNALTSDQRGFVRFFDGDGNGNLTVDMGAFELDPTPPVVVATMRDEGGVLERPDLFQTFAVTFSMDVEGLNNNLLHANISEGVPNIPIGVPFSYDNETFTVEWDLSTLPLSPAYYRLSLSSSIRSVQSGVRLDGDGDGTAGGFYEEPLYVALPGDANLDGQVDVLGDAFALVANLGLTSGATWAQGDFNGDGTVDVLGDAFILVSRLGQSVVPPVSNLTSFAEGSSTATANDGTSTPVASSSIVAQPISFISLKEDDRDQDSDVQPSKKSPHSRSLSLAGCQDLDAAFESGDLIEAGVF